MEIRICSNAVIPPEGAEYVLAADGAVLEQRADAAMGSQGDGDLTVEMDTVRVLLRDGDYAELTAAGRALYSRTGGPMEGFDITVEVPARDGVRYVEVVGLLGGTRIATFVRAVASLDDGAELVMPLRDRCYGVRCGDGQTCIKGTCELAPGPKGGDGCRGVGP